MLLWYFVFNVFEIVYFQEYDDMDGCFIVNYAEKLGNI